MSVQKKEKATWEKLSTHKDNVIAAQNIVKTRDMACIRPYPVFSYWLNSVLLLL